MNNTLAALWQWLVTGLNRSSRWAIWGIGILSLSISVSLFGGLRLNVMGAEGVNWMFALGYGLMGMGLLVPWVVAALKAAQASALAVGIRIKPMRAVVTGILIAIMLHSILAIVPFGSNPGAFVALLVGGVIMIYVNLLGPGFAGLKTVAGGLVIGILAYSFFGLVAGKAEHTESVEAAQEFHSERERRGDLAIADIIRGMNTDPSVPISEDGATALRLANQRGRDESILGRTAERIGKAVESREPIRLTYTLFFGSTKEVYVPEGRWEVRVISNGPSHYRYVCKDASGTVVSNGGADMLSSPSGVIRVQGAKNGETFTSTGGTVSIYNDNPNTYVPGCQVTKAVPVTVELLPKLGIPLSGLW